MEERVLLLLITVSFFVVVDTSGNRCISNDPNVTTFDATATDEEINLVLDFFKERVIETNSPFKASLYLREFKDISNPLLRTLAERLCAQAGFPLSHAEAFSITRYTVGQKYGLHFDTGFHEGNGSMVERVRTAILFLNDVHKGGELVFPRISVVPGEYPAIEKVCASSEPLKVTPEKGASVVFENHVKLKHSEEWGERNPLAIHGSCPVQLAGEEKWIMQLWIRSRPQNIW